MKTNGAPFLESLGIAFELLQAPVHTADLIHTVTHPEARS